MPTEPRENDHTSREVRACDVVAPASAPPNSIGAEKSRRVPTIDMPAEGECASGCVCERAFERAQS